MFNDSSPIGRDSGLAANPFKLLKMFAKGKSHLQFERPHEGKACAIGETEILVGVSFIFLICLRTRSLSGSGSRKVSDRRDVP